MPTKLNSQGKQQNYVPKGNGDASGEYTKDSYNEDVFSKWKHKVSNYTDIRSEIRQKYGNGKDGGYTANTGMSQRAVKAYAEGQMPFSKWDKQSILEALVEENEIDNETLKKLDKMPVKKLKDMFVKKKSWHHTGSFYGETDFYGIDDKWKGLDDQEFINKLDDAENYSRIEKEMENKVDSFTLSEVEKIKKKFEENKTNIDKELAFTDEEIKKHILNKLDYYKKEINKIPNSKLFVFGKKLQESEYGVSPINIDVEQIPSAEDDYRIHQSFMVEEEKQDIIENIEMTEKNINEKVEDFKRIRKNIVNIMNKLNNGEFTAQELKREFGFSGTNRWMFEKIGWINPIYW